MKDKLLDAAIRARQNAYAPYSEYRVGAAVVSSSGGVFSGCNMENASFPLSVCAERHALADMVCAGETELAALLVLTEDGAPPCGGCLQVLSEFAPDRGNCVVYLATDGGEIREMTLLELFPCGFHLKNP